MANAPVRPDPFRGEMERALAAHQAGRLAEAETAYRTILGRAPGYAHAFHFLGVVLHQTGRTDEAAERHLYRDQSRAVTAIRAEFVADGDRPC